jgi:hypothetical protein
MLFVGAAAVVESFCKQRHRRSGLPDLLLWNVEQRKLLLSEVLSDVNLVHKI